MATYSNANDVLNALDPNGQVPHSGSLSTDDFGRYMALQNLATQIMAIQDDTQRQQVIDQFRSQVQKAGDLKNVDASVLSNMAQQGLSSQSKSFVSSNSAAQGILKQLDPDGSLGKNVDLTGVAQYIASIPDGDTQQNAINQFVNNLKQGETDTRGGGALFPFSISSKGALSQSDVNSMLSGLQTEVGNENQAAQQQAASTGQSLPTSSSILNPTASDQVTQDQKDAYKALTGQDFDQSYSDFSQNYVIAAQQYNQETGLPQGQEQLWTSGTPQLSGNYKIGQAVPKSNAPNDGKNYTPTAGQFMYMQSQTTLKVAAQVEQAAIQQWAMTHGGSTDMPNDLRLKIFNDISQMPTDELYQLSAPSSGSTSSTGISGATAPGGSLDVQAYINEYDTEHPDQAKTADVQSTMNSLYTQFKNATGYGPTYQQAQDLVGADQNTITDYINNIKLPSGITVGTKQQADTNMNQLWQDNFHRSPTAQEVTKFAGWSKDDLQSYVDDQPSLDNPTMSIGQRNTYISGADSLSQKLFGTNADSRTAQALHDAFGQG